MNAKLKMELKISVFIQKLFSVNGVLNYGFSRRHYLKIVLPLSMVLERYTGFYFSTIFSYVLFLN